MAVGPQWILEAAFQRLVETTAGPGVAVELNAWWDEDEAESWLRRIAAGEVLLDFRIDDHNRAFACLV